MSSEPSNEYYHHDACKEIDDDKNLCAENCLNKIWGGSRPDYDIGPFGTDCQEYSKDTYSDCVKKCGQP